MHSSNSPFPSTPSLRYLAADTYISHCSGGQGHALNFLLTSLFANHEHTDFLHWYRHQIRARIFKKHQSQRHQPLNSTAYRALLLRVDWTSLASITEFQMLAQPVPREERPAPILLGTESRREYFLAPAPLTIDAVTRKELCDNREWQHEYIYRIRSVDEEAPAPFEYGYCLGTLQVGVPHPYSEMPEGSRLSCVTHFEVWLEVGSEGKRKGVWLVRNGNRGSFNFPFDPLLPWRSVGGPENGMPEFQVLRILEHVSELRNTDRRTGGSFFDGLRDTKLFSTGPVSRWALSVDEVNEALLKPLHDDSDPALLVERIDI